MMTRSACRVALLALALSYPSLKAQEADEKNPAVDNKPRTAESAVTPAMVKQNCHEVIMKQKSKGEIDLLFLGDSISFRFPTHGKETWAKLAPYKPGDFGVGGDRTENVLWRITSGGELDGLKPKVTVLLIGTNNFGQCATEKPEWVAAGIKKILDVIHEKMPGTKVLLVSVFPRGEKTDDPLRGKILELNKLISAYDDGTKTRYLDIYKTFLEPDGTISREMMKDHLHPTAHGYEIWYQAMQPTLDEMMK